MRHNLSRNSHQSNRHDSRHKRRYFSRNLRYHSSWNTLLRSSVQNNLGRCTNSNGTVTQKKQQNKPSVASPKVLSENKTVQREKDVGVQLCLLDRNSCIVLGKACHILLHNSRVCFHIDSQVEKKSEKTKTKNSVPSITPTKIKLERMEFVK